MDGMEIQVMEDIDNIVAAFQNDDDAKLMELSGQGDAPKKTGLPRLSINYDTETEEGTSLPRGEWKIFLDGKFLYASKVSLRPLLRTYEYSLWDQEQETFASKSVQKTGLQGEFPDTMGTNKCGRLSRDEENALSDDDPSYIHSRNVVCNQIIYGQISGTFYDAEKNPTALDKVPVVAYFKRSGFKPVADAIDLLRRNNKLMQRTSFDLTTNRMKKGSVVYYVPVLKEGDAMDIADTDKELMGMFAETVKSHNEYVMKENRESLKKVLSEEDADLADDFDVDAA